MKKLVGFVAAGVLMFGLAGQAKAAFTDGDVIRVMYDASTGVEIATDLGSAASLTSASNLSTATVNLSQFGSTATWSQVNVAYFGNVAGSNTAYVASATAPVAAGSLYSSFSGAVTSIEGVYAGNGGTSTTANADGYYTQMNGSGLNVGTYSNFIPGVNNELNMNSLGTSPQDDLYSIAVTSHVSGRNTTYTYVTTDLMTLNTTLNGNVAGTIINEGTSATPVPPSLLLMGSGLLGLIGVGRRKLFA